jgi:ABC-2 type transport system permease protein
VITTLRSEWIKLRTVRMNVVLVAIAAAFPLVVSVLTAALQKPADIDTEGLAGVVVGTSVVSAMLLGVIGALSIGSEFTHGTIRPTFAATPRRARVIVAKAIVDAVVAGVVAAVIVGICFAVSAGIASSRDVRVTLDGAPGVVPGMIGLVLLAMIVTLLGLGLGMLIRNQAAAISALILWPLLIESLLAGLLYALGVDKPTRWMPYNAGITMASPATGPQDIGRVQGGLYFFAVTLFVVVVGAVLVERRDA